MKNYYEILGLSKESSEEEIKKTFRKKAMEFHPDKNQGNAEAEQKMKELNEAYSILSNPEKRRLYDSGGLEERSETGFGGFNFNGFGFGDMEETIAEMLRGMHGESFMGGSRQKQQTQTINGSVNISLKDVLLGSNHKIKTKLNIVCHVCVGQAIDPMKPIGNCFTCNGTGSVTQLFGRGFGRVTATCPECKGTKKKYAPCNECKGEGNKAEEKEVEIALPQGFRGGHIQVGVKTNSPAPTMAIISVNLSLPQDVTFDKDVNVIKTIKINFSDLILGQPQFPIEMIDGEKVNIKIPPGTQSNQLVRLKGKGIPVEPRSHEKSDFLLKLSINIPNSLTPEQQKAIETLKSSGL